MDKEEPSTFKEWIMQYVELEIAYGDLARDMRDDSELPDTNQREEYEWYLNNIKNACYNACSTLSSAFDDYEKYLDKFLEKQNKNYI